MRPHGSAVVLEERRKQAVRRLRAGESVLAVAASLGVSDRSVRAWRQLANEGGGLRALKAKPQHVPTSGMSESQKRKLKKLLLKGAVAAGYATDLWTCARVAEAIRQKFGIEYHPDQVGLLLHDMGYCCQKPSRRAKELLRHNATGNDFFWFLFKLHQELKRDLIAVWDRLSGHRMAARCFQELDCRWLQFECLPPYCPGLDPSGALGKLACIQH